MLEGDLFKGGGGFGEEDEVELIVGPVGQWRFDGLHAQARGRGDGGAIHVSGGGFLHPGW